MRNNTKSIIINDEAKTQKQADRLYRRLVGKRNPGYSEHSNPNKTVKRTGKIKTKP